MTGNRQKDRERMVREDLQFRGIESESVLNSMRLVPRHEFVDPAMACRAYDDQPLPIGYMQTISQPYIVAVMIECAEVKSTDNVLEIGSGSGYSAAVLSNIARKVTTVETINPLADRARSTLERLQYNNVDVICEDGSLGWPAAAPYDAIIVTAAAPSSQSL